MASLSASTFTGVRVARDRAATRRATIDTAVVARRTKASAPSKKGAFKVRETTARRGDDDDERCPIDGVHDARIFLISFDRSIEWGRAIEGVRCGRVREGCGDIDRGERCVRDVR